MPDLCHHATLNPTTGKSVYLCQQPAGHSGPHASSPPIDHDAITPPHGTPISIQSDAHNPLPYRKRLLAERAASDAMPCREELIDTLSLILELSDGSSIRCYNDMAVLLDQIHALAGKMLGEAT